MVFYYEVPHQVQFVWAGRTQRGIAFHEYIINKDTGVFHRTDEILREAERYGISADDAIVEHDDWQENF